MNYRYFNHSEKYYCIFRKCYTKFEFKTMVDIKAALSAKHTHTNEYVLK